jgi:hypothetical protein
MKKALLVTALLATVGYGGWRLAHRGGSPATTMDDNKLALDRIWIDHLPRTERDTIQIFAAVSEENFGVFQQTSVWKGNFELFQFKAQGDKLKVVFPQDNDKEELRTKARPCNEGQMDYCLEIEGSSRGVKKYYSRKGWEIDSTMTAQDVEHRAEALAEQLEAGLPADAE